MMSRRCKRAVLCCITVFASVSAQVSLRPDFFIMPEPEDTIDSTQSSFTTSQKREQRQYESENTLTVSRCSDRRFFHQTVLYEAKYDPSQSTQEHYLEIPGTYLLKNRYLRSDYAGLEWRPDFDLSTTRLSKQLQGKMDLGPVLHYSPWGIPLKMGAGVSGAAWHTAVPSAIHWSTLYDSVVVPFQSDVGVYGELAIPQARFTLGQWDALFAGEAFGRSTNAARMVQAGGIWFMRRGLASQDSAFLFLGDTVTNGNSGLISETGGERPKYLNRDPVLQNSAFGALGIRGKPRLSLIPALTVSASQWQQSFPGDPLALNDRLDRRVLLAPSLETDSAFIIGYQGSIQTVWSKRDWMYHREVGDGDMLPVLDRNNEDYTGFEISMSHTVFRYLPNGIGASYRFDVSRDSKTYPNSYVQGDTTIRSSEDNDRIGLHHTVDVTVLDLEKCEVALHGRYAENTLSYVKALQSGANVTDSSYEVGLSVGARLFDRIAIEDTTRATVEASPYHFPREHVGDYPSYQRKVISVLRAEADLFRSLGFALEWRERYNDLGRWYGTGYLDTAGLDSAARARNAFDYYGVESKNWDHTVKGSAILRLSGSAVLEIGCKYHDQYFRIWDGRLKEYVVESLGTGYRINPFARFRAQWKGSVTVDALLSPWFDTIEGNYLDFALKARVIF